ncbi:hypothetical protein JMJ77_0004719 [Colletotrichum scovillei]|uniref:Uncharacterized protein n=1 Tax=Colletotrichum scovillei TaxID=1209932 RepID=A0A9P7RHZ8_9PEZI|nr:hypothetical protein JMJ77_0004719 [Colletotrichum scovillei]KAG7075927.1 hypothetical protein JMJ76_0013201 [Colletotrichum scovillei]KAG7083107.1 hypothetical protein JMJ78_0008557 [Colletotrichum scovillei]
MPFLKPAPRSANIRIERVAKVKVNVLKPVSSGVKKPGHVTKSSPSSAKGKSSPKPPSKVDKVIKKTSTESTKAKSTELKSPNARTDPKTPKPKTKGKPINKASGDPAPIPSSTKTSNRVTKRTKKTKELPKGLVAIGSFGSAAATHRAQLGAGKSNVRLLPTALPVPLPSKKEEVEASAKGSAEPKEKKKKKVTIASVGLTTPSPTPSRGSSVSRKQ